MTEYKDNVVIPNRDISSENSILFVPDLITVFGQVDATTTNSENKSNAAEENADTPSFSGSESENERKQASHVLLSFMQNYVKG